MVFKVSIFIKKHPDMTDEQFREYWSEHHAKLFLQTAKAKKLILRYGQFYVNKKLGSEIASNAPNMETLDYDGVGDFWTNSVEEVLEYLGDEEYQRDVFPDEFKFTKRDEWKIMVGEYDDKFVHDLVKPQG